MNYVTALLLMQRPPTVFIPGGAFTDGTNFSDGTAWTDMAAPVVPPGAWSDGTFWSDGTGWVDSAVIITPPPDPGSGPTPPVPTFPHWGLMRGPAEFDMWVEQPTQVTTGAESETGWTEVLTGFSRCRAVVTWGVTTPAQAATIEAFLGRFHGRSLGQPIPNFKYTQRIGTAAGTWTVNGFHRADAERLRLTGGSGSFAPGDWIEVEQIIGVPRAYMVTDWSSGIATIAPALHDNVSGGVQIKHLGDGATLVVRDIMELVSKPGPATIFPALDYGAVNRRTVEFVSYRRTAVVPAVSIVYGVINGVDQVVNGANRVVVSF